MSLVAVFLGLVVARAFENDTDVPLRETVRAAAVIVALVPQGLAVMITVSYAMAAVRLAGSGVLIQRMNAVESISHVDMLCLDKTGTLTTNRLTVESLEPYGVERGQLGALLGTFAASASFRNRTADALQEAFPASPRRPAGEVPFDSSRKWSGLAFNEGDAGVYVLGAPEVLAEHCHGGARAISDTQRWTASGLRVLLFASRAESGPFEYRDGEPILPDNLTALGLAILRDETRPDAADVVAELQSAGVDVRIISGDNPDTVASLIRQAGLSISGEPVAGSELATVDDAALGRIATANTVFGRVSPRDKERIVNALRRGGRYVAMVGDGVNDVPALKAAQVAVALRSGSPITRDVADMLLLDDAFSSLPRGFREGQRIRKGMEDIFRLFLTRTLSLTLIILFVSLLDDPFPVTPRHTAMIAILSVGIPSFFLAVWAKPGRPEERVILSAAGFVLPAAISIAAVSVVVYEFFLSLNSDVELARTALTLTATSCGLLLLLFLEPPTPAWVAANPPGDDLRPTLLAVALGGVFAAFMAVPASRDFYELVLPNAWGFLVIGLVVIAWAMTLRSVWRLDPVKRLESALRRRRPPKT
jgi:cation-transporting ATPase E